MSQDKKGGDVGLGVGGSSILVIFVVLCLTTFATLSLTSANADYRLTRMAAEHTAGYYRADGAAEDMLAALAQCLDTHSAEALPAALAALGFTYTPGVGGTAPTAAYDIPMSGDRRLHVEVEIPTLKRLCWQVQTAPAASAPEPAGNIGNLPVF